MSFNIAEDEQSKRHKSSKLIIVVIVLCLKIYPFRYTHIQNY